MKSINRSTLEVVPPNKVNHLNPIDLKGLIGASQPDQSYPLNAIGIEEAAKKYFSQKHQYIRIDEVSALTTLAKSSINLWVSQGKFLAPITLSPTVKIWKLQDVIDWVESHKESK
jgi:prophage regulatory protein